MANSKLLVIVPLVLISVLSTQSSALVPYTRSLWDMMTNDNIFPYDDPFRILEQTPMAIPRSSSSDHHHNTLALARADWKETPEAHVIELDVPGMTREDVKVEVEENRVLRISGERRSESESDGEGDKWHRAERIACKFWRQFRMPGNADLDRIRARLENGVLRITVPKLAEEKRRQPKIIGIEEESSTNNASAEDIRAIKTDL